MVRQAQSREKLLQKKLEEGLTEKPRRDAADVASSSSVSVAPQREAVTAEAKRSAARRAAEDSGTKAARLAAQRTARMPHLPFIAHACAIAAASDTSVDTNNNTIQLGAHLHIFALVDTTVAVSVCHTPDLIEYT